jgi:transcriptional regulator with XRE-family HTH domain
MGSLKQRIKPASRARRVVKSKGVRPEYKIGGKLRRARLVAKLKLHELADRCGLSKALLSRIENDKINPSIGSLHDIALALGINLSGLFAEDRDLESQVVLRKGERRTIAYRRDGSRIESFVPFGKAHLLQGFLMIEEPGGQSQGILTHYGEEVGYVLHGELELSVSGNLYHLKEGDSFNFRSEEPHGHRNPGKTRAVVIWVNTPPTM